MRLCLLDNGGIIMKRLVFKKWVMVVLAIINVIAFMVIASDCENELTYLVSHLIAGGVFALTIMLFNKYGRKGWL